MNAGFTLCIPIQCGACQRCYGVIPVGPGVHTVASPGLKTGTVPGQYERGLTLHSDIFFGLVSNSISTVRPPGETVANRHELCPQWRYGDCRLDYGISWRRAGVAPTLAGRTTVWHGSSRWILVKLRWSYGMTTAVCALIIFRFYWNKIFHIPNEIVIAQTFCCGNNSYKSY